MKVNARINICAYVFLETSFCWTYLLWRSVVVYVPFAGPKDIIVETTTCRVDLIY